MAEITTLALALAFVALLLLDRLRPARAFPAMRFWRLKGIAFTALTVTVSTLAPFVWDGLLHEHRLFDGSSLGVAGGAAVGFLAVELMVYAWHRTLHRVPFLFRWLHQTHHAAERLDVYGANLFHPLDAAGFSLVYSLALVWATGVLPEAAAVALNLVTFLALFQHANLRTPAWLGYLVQRPEQHAVHHQRGVHAYNYCDLPLIDLAFGTMRNPATWEGEVGYYDGASERLLALALGRDVTEPPRTSSGPSPSTPDDALDLIPRARASSSPS